MSKPYPHCIEGCKFTVDGKCNYRNMHVKTVAVDFDRVLFTHESWQGHEHYGDPLPGVREALLELREMGFKIMIWTTRDQIGIINKACTEHDFPFDYINCNPNQPPEINPSKPVADYYIDDRGVHFTSWEKALAEIKARERHDPYYAQGEEQKTDGPENGCVGCSGFQIHEVAECSIRGWELDFEEVDRVAKHGCIYRKEK